MKILLVDPKRLNLETYLIIPNLGLAYLATALRRAGHEPFICNAARDSIKPEKVADIASENNFDVVGITIFTPFFNSSAVYAQEIRRKYPRARIVAGGPHAIFESEEILNKMPDVDYVVSGEGEETFPLLLAELEKKETPDASSLSAIPNLCYRDGQGAALTKRKLIDDIRPLDLPAWDLHDPKKFSLYPNGIFTKKNKVAPLITTRGCPYSCRFCAAGVAMGKKLRHRDPDSIVDEMTLLKKDHDIHEIQIMDDNFAADAKFAMKVCETIIRRNTDVVWGCPPGIRIDCISDELISAMKRAGCYSTSLGIESGSQRVLNLMKKRINLNEVPEKIAILKKHGIRSTGLFILGYPGETVQEMRETINLSLKLDINRVNFFTFTPFPGSEIYDELKVAGKLDNLDYDELYIHNLGYCDDSIPEKDLIKLQRNSHFRFYLRPKIMLGIAREIHSFTQLKIIFQRAFRIIFPKKRERGPSTR
ncbi:MAG TPA: radical SAM protein [bacterium]|nr:radical SAM protein [bacterium]